MLGMSGLLQGSRAAIMTSRQFWFMSHTWPSHTLIHPPISDFINMCLWQIVSIFLFSVHAYWFILYSCKIFVLYRGGDILLYLSPLICLSDQFCVCAFSPSVMQAVKHETLTQCRAIFGHLLRRWANISPVLGYRVVFDATLNVGQRHRRWANINRALVQSTVPVVQPAWSRPTDYGWMDTGQHRRHWPNI